MRRHSGATTPLSKPQATLNLKPSSRLQKSGVGCRRSPRRLSTEGRRLGESLRRRFSREASCLPSLTADFPRSPSFDFQRTNSQINSQGLPPRLAQGFSHSKLGRCSLRRVLYSFDFGFQDKRLEIHRQKQRMPCHIYGRINAITLESWRIPVLDFVCLASR